MRLSINHSINISGNGDNNSGEGEERVHHGSATLPGGCSLTSGGSGTGGGGGGSASGTGVKLTSDEGSECSSVTSESIPHSSHPHSTSHPTHHPNPHQHLNPSNCTIEALLTEIREQREEFDRLRRNLDDNKVSFKHPHSFSH